MTLVDLHAIETINPHNIIAFESSVGQRGCIVELKTHPLCLVSVPDPLTRSYNEKLEKRGEEEGLVKLAQKNLYSAASEA